MFLLYEYRGFLGYEKKTKQYRHRYKIIDSDFEAVGVAGAGKSSLAGAVGVIQEYSKRNLNVAANLVRAFQYSGKQYGYSINEIIEYNREYNPEFHKYEKDLKKYLCLV